MAEARRLFILDANALLHRAWHALPPLTSPEGKVVNAVYGVLMTIMKLIDERKPSAFVACWDTEAPTFRHTAYEAYKAHREEQPDELYDQVPWLKEGLSLLGVDSLELDGYEADDLIGTIAVKARKAGWDVTIVTGDRDALQLIRPGIRVLAFKKGVSETITFDENELKNQYGLTPQQFLDYKAMRGDPSDNIPGVKGIGDKGATDLLMKYGSLKGIVKAAKDPKSDMAKGQREKILAAEKELPGILELVRIKTDAPISYTPGAGSAVVKDREALLDYLRRFGFKSLITKVEGRREEKIGEQPVPESKKKRTSQRPAFEDVLVETEADAVSALQRLRKEEWCIVQVSRGAVGSLFAESVDGLVLAGKDTGFFFPADSFKHATVRKALCDFLNDPSIRKAAHDAKAQMKGLAGLGCPTTAWAFDTLLAAYLLSAGERNHDLEILAMQYAGMSVPEDASALRKAEAVSAIIPRLRLALTENHLMRVLERFELPLIPILFDMERVGIKIDVTHLRTLSKELTKARQDIEERMYEAAGKTFNPGSPAQLAQVLFEDLKLPSKGIKRGKTGFSTAASELEKLRGSHPIIELIEEQRELSKLLSTYVDVLPGLADESGRVHTTFNQAVAATGRLSSTDPNLQNIPIRTEVGRKIRRAFIPEKGYRLLSCDYSQIELRIAAALAKDERMLEAFRRGDDIHTATAAAIWKVDLADVTKDQRRIAKAINFGLIFGQGPQGLSQVAGISFADAKKFIAAYFEAYSGIKRYMEETKAMARSLGYVETLFGRRRLLPEINSNMHMLRAQAERMAINMPVQGTDADLMKLAMIALRTPLLERFPRTRMLLQVHDELLFEVPEKDVEAVASFVKDIMEHVEKIGVPIVVEAKAGKNWDEMTKL